MRPVPLPRCGTGCAGNVADGGRLTSEGLANITRMLSLSSVHHQTACLLAWMSTVVGFALTRIDPGDGLCPGLLGELVEFCVVPEAWAGDQSRPGDRCR